MNSKKTALMKHIFTFFLLAGLLLVSNSCTKNFVKDNTNPTNATAEQLKYDNIGLGGFITQMEYEVIPVLKDINNVDLNNFQLIYSLMGDIYSGQQGTSDAYGNNGVNNSTYAMIPGWYGTAFANAYLNEMAPWYNVKQQSAISSPSTYALAQILKVMAMHRVTDIYGPLPYLKYQTAAIGTPYDAQQDIYKSFFTDLDAAIAVLTDFVSKNPGAVPLAKFDKIYQGDFTKWLKFANTLKLRLAMRIVYADPVTAQTEAEAAVKAGVMTANGDNALIKVDGVSTQNPLYGICYSYNDTRMGANMESFLKGYNDPRAPLLFNQVAYPATSTATYHGVRNGIIFSGQAYSPFSTLNVTATTPVQWMVAAEAYFLRAEGALRGWNMGGQTAQSLYESGISTSFSQNMGATNAAAGSATAYIADAASKPAPYVDPMKSGNSVAAGTNLSTITIHWNTTDPFETNLERIITQKWIAIYPDGQEAWSEFRRTRYPKVFPVVTNDSGGLISTSVQIRRSPFPQSEYLNDNAAVTQGVTLLGGADNGGTKLWWDKKP